MRRSTELDTAIENHNFNQIANIIYVAGSPCYVQEGSLNYLKSIARDCTSPCDYGINCEALAELARDVAGLCVMVPSQTSFSGLDN